jgi:hypothetical protein
MRALQDKGKQKYCNLLIFEKAEPFVESCAKDDLIHPFCWFDQDTRNIGSKWEWFKQASRIFSLVDKDCTYIPEVGDVVFDAVKEKITYIEDENDLKNYKPINATFPAQLTENEKRRLKKRKTDYLIEHNLEKADKIVTTGHRNARDSPTNTKTTVYKGRTIDWITKTNVNFNQIETEEKKINLKTIFEITSDEEKFKSGKHWTDRQRSWIKDGIDVEGLFKKNIKTISRISDFRTKFFMSYWGKLQNKCELCNEEWHRDHLFLYCPKVREWEKGIYKDNKTFLTRKKKCTLRPQISIPLF